MGRTQRSFGRYWVSSTWRCSADFVVRDCMNPNADYKVRATVF
jgi:hypothetical protein